MAALPSFSNSDCPLGWLCWVCRSAGHTCAKLLSSCHSEPVEQKVWLPGWWAPSPPLPEKGQLISPHSTSLLLAFRYVCLTSPTAAWILNLTSQVAEVGPFLHKCIQGEDGKCQPACGWECSKYPIRCCLLSMHGFAPTCPQKGGFCAFTHPLCSPPTHWAVWHWVSVAGDRLLHCSKPFQIYSAVKSRIKKVYFPE